MEELLVAGLLLVWLAVAVVIGRWVYNKKQSRALQVAAMLLALWLPLWDLLPGYVMFRKVVQEIGGVRIYREVQADGYLNRATVLGKCWTRLARSPYAYCEHKEPELERGSLGPLNARAGFYQYLLSPIDAVECAPFREHFDSAAMQARYSLGPRCIVAIRRDQPFSRYEYNRGTDTLAGPALLPPVHIGWQRVRDLTTGDTVAQATTVGYTPWILRGMQLRAGWSYIRDESGLPIIVDPIVLIPPSNTRMQ